MRLRASACSVGLVFCVASLAAAAQEFKAGIAVADITPPLGFRMSGYFSERLSTGIKDPLKAKAVVFEQDSDRAAIVFCDLIGISLDVSSRARELASKEAGIPASNIAITATHSHTGPLYFGALRQHFRQRAIDKHGSDPCETIDYTGQLVEKLVEAIKSAQATARPVRLAAGVAREDRLSFNRRFHMKDGTVRFNPGQLNPDIVRAAGPIDPDVGVVRIDDADGAGPHGAIVSFALHLDTVGGTEYSADYPKFLEEHLQKSLGGGFTSLFGAGTCGDINHVDVSIRGRRRTDEIGMMLGQTVADALPELPVAGKPSLAVRTARVNAPLQKYSAERIAEARQKMDLVDRADVPFLERVETYKIMALELLGGDTLPLEVQVFRLSSDVAIVTLPGEVFVDLGLAIKKASPFKTTLVVELANDAPGYIPTRKAFAEGSYETVNSRVQSGGGELMVETAIRLLQELN